LAITQRTNPTSHIDLLPTARRPWRVVAFSVAAGVLLAILWSYEFVDKVIGDNVANALLGHDAKETAIGGTVAGLVFAFVSGLAGTFTACNIAMAASIGPMSHAGAVRDERRSELATLLRPLGWMTLGMVIVSGLYGFVGVLIGDGLPQLSTETVGDMPVRIVQSSVVFGIIGLGFVYLGLAALKVLPDPFEHRPAARVFVLGALVGGFVIGRPYPLFNKLFHWAADTGNPFYGAGAFILQSLGNVAIVSVLFALIVLVSRGGFLRWFAGNPRRAVLISGSLLLALGVFTVVYWDIRVPSMFGFGWFPRMPYN